LARRAATSSIRSCAFVAVASTSWSDLLAVASLVVCS
jgi:hypothetical protein